MKKLARKNKPIKLLEHAAYRRADGAFVTVLPVRILSTANMREHHFTKARRIKKLRELGICITSVPLPVTVTLVRVAPIALDGDNLQNAFKGLRDGIADRFGVPDNHPGLHWKYDQRKAGVREYGVEVVVTYG